MRPLSGVVPLIIFNPGEEAVTVKMGVTIASMEQLAKNYNMCIPCDKKTICVIAKSVLGIGYGHEGWKKHYHG